MASTSAKAANTALTIAQLKLKAVLRKADDHMHLQPVSGDVVTQFCRDVDSVLEEDTPANVQKCRVWIVTHVLRSEPRATALGDYLSSVSKFVLVNEPEPSSRARKQAFRRRFDLLLIISDVMHHAKYHNKPPVKPVNFARDAMCFLPRLMELATEFSTKDANAAAKLKALVNYWAKNSLINVEQFNILRHRVEYSIAVTQGKDVKQTRNYLLPEWHGDPSARWSDLPASCMLESMIRNPSRPIISYRVKPVKLDRKPVSERVRNLLDTYFDNIDLKYLPTGDNPKGETEKYRLSLDPLGQMIKQDKTTGLKFVAFNGYGWSPKFCQDMRNLRLPESIKNAREEAQKLPEETFLHPHSQQRRDSWPRPGSSGRRQRSSSENDNFHGSRPGSRSSFGSQDSRPPSRNSRPASRDSRPSSRQGRPRHWGDGDHRSSSRSQGRDHGYRRDQNIPPPNHQPWSRQNLPRSLPQQPLGAVNVAPPPPPGLTTGPRLGQLPFNPPFPFPGFGVLPPGAIPPPPPPPANYAGPYPPPPPPPPMTGLLGNSGGFRGGRGGYGGSGRGGNGHRGGGYGGARRGQGGDRRWG